MTVRESVVVLVDGDASPLALSALRLAGLLDDPDLSARDAAGLSRELRLVLEEWRGSRPVDRSDGVFDLASRRRDRENRRQA